MKFSLVPVALLASTASAWRITVYENSNCGSSRYYSIEGSGTRNFAPWSGGSSSALDFCRIFWNGGDNWKSCSEGSSGFTANSIVVHSGRCVATSGSSTSQSFAGRPACNFRDGTRWERIRCSD
jgi:hypothetical protein